MTGDFAAYAAGFAAGLGLGALYLGLLWAGVRTLARPRPAATFLALVAARASLVLGALAVALALGAGAGALFAALAGFLAVRVAATRLARAADGGSAWR